MRNAKRKVILAGAVAAAAMGVVAVPHAQAAFTVSYTTSTVGPDTVYHFSALNTGSGTGTKLLAENITFTTPGTGTSGAIVFQSTDIDGDGYKDANVFGAPAVNLGTETAGTMSRISTVPNFSVAGLYTTPAEQSSATNASYETNPGGLTSQQITASYVPTALDPAFANNTLHYLNIVGGVTASKAVTDTSAVVFATAVVPTGTTLTLAGSLAGDSGSAYTFTNLVVGGSGPTTGAQKVISLLTTASQGTAPTGYGANPLATLAVSPNGKSTSVSLGGTGATSGYVAVTGGPAPYYALSLDVNGAAATASALQQIVGDINNNSTGVTATYLASGGAFGLGFAPGILLSDSVAGSSQYFSFDFSSSGSDLSLGDTTLGPVTVVAIAAVPEPATAAGIIIGASGLLLGRRRKRDLVG